LAYFAPDRFAPRALLRRSRISVQVTPDFADFLFRRVAELREVAR
jgi:hypothetical protein